MNSHNLGVTGATESRRDRSHALSQQTRWAADRTQIAWIRTAIAMVGTPLVAFAVLGLFGAVIQNLRIDRRLAKEGCVRVERVPLGLFVSILVLLIGILGLIAIHI